MPRVLTKTETLSVRIAPDIKEQLRQAAVQDRRSLANMLEVMVDAWCKERGISVVQTKSPHKQAKKA